MWLLVKILFIITFFLSADQKIFAFEQWQELHPDPMVTWQIANGEITGQMWQPIGINFLVTKAEYFPVTADFIWQVEFIPQQGADHNFVWGFVDEKNYYQLHFAGGSVWVNRFITGNDMLAKGINFSWRENQSYLIKIKRTNGLLSIFIDNYEVFHFYDWTYDETTSVGSWGFKLAAGSVYPVKAVFKNLQFLAEDIFSLPIKKILQIDPLWTATIYDHAQLWSDVPTIGDWGCALTSVVMVLRYHGFEVLPSGEALTPPTLNDWLKNEPDGYIADGLVNWWAVTRLVSQLSNQVGNLLPKLEFKVVKENLLLTAEMLLRANTPPIANVPGHFVVLTGFIGDAQDFLIADPLSQTEKLSDYAALLSLRVFQPSFTDLSYLVVAHPPQTTVELKDKAGRLLETVIMEEKLTADQAPVMLTTFAQPIEQQYTLEFANLSLDFLPTVYVYAKDATITKFQLVENTLARQKIIINFKKNSSSLINYFYDWADFLQLVDYFFERQKISLTAKNRMVGRVELIKKTTDKIDRERQINYLKNLLLFYKNFADLLAIEELITVFTALTSQPE